MTFLTPIAKQPRNIFIGMHNLYTTEEYHCVDCICYNAVRPSGDALRGGLEDSEITTRYLPNSILCATFAIETSRKTYKFQVISLFWKFVLLVKGLPGSLPVTQSITIFIETKNTYEMRES